MVVVASHHHDTCAIAPAPPMRFTLRPPASLVFGDALSMRAPRLFWMDGTSNGIVVHLAILKYVKGS
jgi:hypothetical protein